MKNRLSFTIIGVLIAVALACIVTFQGFWLMGLYKTLYNQMDTNISDAMRLADYKELFYRMQELKERNEGKSEEFARSFSFGNNMEVLEEEKVEENSNFINNDVNLNLNGVDLKTQIDEVLSELLHTLGNMEGIILQGMHDEIDPLIPINYQRYDSLLVNELKSKNIDTRFQLNLVYGVNEKHTVFKTLGKNHPGMETDTTSAAIDWKGSVHYDYPITLNKHNRRSEYASNNKTISDPFYYRLYIKSPAGVVLNQMFGILLSSFLVLVIIVSTFTYLLRTIMRQKTLEELKTDFTNNMTHELKTPISVSYAAVDSLLNFGDQINDKQRKYLSIVEKQLTHLAGLVEQILTLSVENRNTFKLRLEQVPLLYLVNQLIDQYRVKSGPNAQFTINISEDIILTADKTHLYNIINNLVDNAIKYTDKTPTEITLNTEIKDDMIRISISDNGPGISLIHQKRIFDKFYRIPNGNLHNVKGHGLGLFYVKDVMKKHGGDVTIESQPGKGSVFHLDFNK